MAKVPEGNNREGEFLGSDKVKGGLKLENSNGHVTINGGISFNSSIDTPSSSNPVPRHLPGTWTLPKGE